MIKQQLLSLLQKFAVRIEQAKKQYRALRKLATTLRKWKLAS
jgi:hypothetical protein